MSHPIRFSHVHVLVFYKIICHQVTKSATVDSYYSMLWISEPLKAGQTCER